MLGRYATWVIGDYELAHRPRYDLHTMGHCELPIWIPTNGRKSYPYMGLPKMGVPLNHPSLFGIFHYQPTILGYNHQFYFGFSV